MEIVNTEKVNVPHSVIISGITNTNLDKKVQEDLETHGPINRHLVIDDPTSKFHHHVIIEFQESSAMLTLRPLLPLMYKTPHDAEVMLTVQALESVTTLDASSSATEGYLEALQNIARASGRSFQDMLQEELKKMITQGETSSPALSPQASLLWNPDPKNPAKGPEMNTAHLNLAGGDAAAKTHPVFTVSDVIPHNVQKMIVEHVVKNDVATSHQNVSFHLRVFSGKSPRPNSEPDYDTWRASVEFLMIDPSISDLHRTQKILHSLLPPATDVIRQLTPHPQSILSSSTQSMAQWKMETTWLPSS